VADLRKDRLKECAWAIMHLVLLAKKTHFFSFTETNDEISLVLEHDAVSLFPPDILSLSPKLYRAFEATLKDEPSTKSIVSDLSQPLAAFGISIMYLSTFKTDFVLISEPDIELAITTLKQHFVISSDSDLLVKQIAKAKSTPQAGAIPIKSSKQHGGPELLFGECEDDLSGRPSNEKPSYNLAVNKTQELHLVSLTRDQMGANSLRLIFEEERALKDFFSYHQMDSEISMVLSSEEKNEMEHEGMDFSCVNESFARITIDEGPLGFDETGIVCSISTPLSDANILLFYISTYATDHILVSTADLGESIKVLEANRMKTKL